ncbi:MAG: hypothetical protein GY696_21445, partial [Gammaproteobacteria bacterium]|nr:hypothetical protein [Gammaproteobacteria bacterium]
EMLLPTVLANSFAYTIIVALDLFDSIMMSQTPRGTVQQVSDGRIIRLLMVHWILSVYSLVHPCLLFYKCPKLRIRFASNKVVALAPSETKGGVDHRINPEENDKIVNDIWNKTAAVAVHR